LGEGGGIKFSRISEGSLEGVIEKYLIMSVHLKSDPTRVVALGESDFIRAINIFQVYQVLHYLHSTDLEVQYIVPLL
jgi:hypothetical protein